MFNFYQTCKRRKGVFLVEYEWGPQLCSSCLCALLTSYYFERKRKWKSNGWSKLLVTYCCGLDILLFFINIIWISYHAEYSYGHFFYLLVISEVMADFYKPPVTSNWRVHMVPVVASLRHAKYKVLMLEECTFRSYILIRGVYMMSAAVNLKKKDCIGLMLHDSYWLQVIYKKPV